MKKKSGHRRRTKVVRRSRKNSRRTVKRKSLGKGRRRPTRRYSRVQRGGEDVFSHELIEKADKGDKDSQYSAGNVYQFGKGVAPDYDKAIYYYKLASAVPQSVAKAEDALGYMFANGQGVARDDAEAVHYYGLAAAHGHEEASRKLMHMKKRMYMEKQHLSNPYNP